MQDSLLDFTFTQLPAAATAPLLRTYLSIFGEVAALDYNPEGRTATVHFASINTDKILTVQHKFMGMPICIRQAFTPASALAPSPLDYVDSPRSSSPNFRYCSNSRVAIRFNDLSCLYVAHPFGSSMHSSYDDLPELLHCLPPAASSPLPAPHSPDVAVPSSLRVRPASLPPSDNNDAAPNARKHLTPESIKFDSVDQMDAWAQVAHHLASGKWPAPQVLPLLVWCLALFFLAL
jgi:hypothetical protein